LNAAGGILYAYMKYREKQKLLTDSQEGLPLHQTSNGHAGPIPLDSSVKDSNTDSLKS